MRRLVDYYNLISLLFPFSKLNAGQTPAAADKLAISVPVRVAQLFQQLAIDIVQAQYVFVRADAANGRSPRFFEFVSNMDDQLTVYDLMRKTGRTHLHAARILEGYDERDFVGLDDLDRVYLLVDRTLDHASDDSAADPGRTIERNILNPSACE
jgi:hypothetical protein